MLVTLGPSGCRVAAVKKMRSERENRGLCVMCVRGNGKTSALNDGKNVSWANG